MPFPDLRKRRLRRTENLRRLARETRLSIDNLVAPLFVEPGAGVRRPIPSMPGQFRFSPDTLAAECTELAALGIPAVILFGIPPHKDPEGSEAWRADGIVQEAVRAVKERCPDLVVITDICLCEYTDHGHCGVLVDGDVDNDPTLELLGRVAVSQAAAGADMVAPSDMMDGRVAAIRAALDDADFTEVPIMSYAAKYASAFYGPFRDAADSAPARGDRRGYQMDPPNAREALTELALDEAEGADILMVKPALPYLDIIRAAREQTLLPLAAYQVSGEYAMIHAAADRGWIDRDRIMIETLTAIRRAGADIVLTYFAREVAEHLREDRP